MNTVTQADRDAIADRYFGLVEFEPYPVQQEALLAWFTAPQGVLVSAPTGTGKTLIAEAAMFEALQLGCTAYYTTPLIALTDQKFRELQAAAVRWGFSPDDVGLVTGNRRVNPDARILVVVAEILLNRLLHREALDFSQVWAVVMDEFHSFNDPERGIVWEFSLELLPKTVRTLLLSATVGNAYPFSRWLETRHDRNLTLVQSRERRIPLTYEWIGDQLLDELLERLVEGPGDSVRTPALVFCFNREQCWSVAELLKGKKLISPVRQRELSHALERYDWSGGAAPKLRAILQRGVGVHHAGVLPKFRRIVEQLFQEKLLSVCVCTETLAAGINLPARSVVLPSLMKGPPDKMKLVDPSSAHQMFGRAGRPQFDDRGFVYALAHEDDVKILRWREKYDQIPENTADPNLIRAKKQLKKKMPTRREGVAYWGQSNFEALINAAPADLASRGPLPWRLLAYMLNISPEVEPIRTLVANRLLSTSGHQQAQGQLNRMLLTLWQAGYIELDPKPTTAHLRDDRPHAAGESAPPGSGGVEAPKPTASPTLDLGQRTRGKLQQDPRIKDRVATKPPSGRPPEVAEAEAYRPIYARPTEKLVALTKLRGVHPLYGLYLVNQLGVADRSERLLAFESLLELPKSLGPAIRVPPLDVLPPGPLAIERVDPRLLKLGLATAAELGGSPSEQDDARAEAFQPVLTLPDKLLRLFEFDFPNVHDVRVWPVWVAGEVLQFADFDKYISSYKLQKQEGLILRHLLRLILLIDEFAMLCPPETTLQAWQDDLGEIADQLERICRQADSDNTNQWLDEAKELRAGL